MTVTCSVGARFPRPKFPPKRPPRWSKPLIADSSPSTSLRVVSTTYSLNVKLPFRSPSPLGRGGGVRAFQLFYRHQPIRVLLDLPARHFIKHARNLERDLILALQIEFALFQLLDKIHA